MFLEKRFQVIKNGKTFFIKTFEEG